MGVRRRRRGWKSVAVIRRMIKVRVQTRSLRLAGGFRICHYIDTRIRYGHAAMYDRLLLGTTDAPRTNDQRQKPGRSRGLQLVESGLGSRNARKGPIHQYVSRWLVKDDLQMTAQPASSPGRGEEFGKRRRATCSEARVGCRTGAFLCRVREERT